MSAPVTGFNNQWIDPSVVGCEPPSLLFGFFIDMPPTKQLNSRTIYPITPRYPCPSYHSRLSHARLLCLVIPLFPPLNSFQQLEVVLYTPLPVSLIALFLGFKLFVMHLPCSPLVSLPSPWLLWCQCVNYFGSPTNIPYHAHSFVKFFNNCFE